ncbi:hypothetical protein [Zhongshania aliphaticivorans]|uniref:hypothetical protein n=1 Tax=Zhongshania aliphaticivorans TaxID=1470434 RepID=UPI0012E4EA81|nr:hypothetical protein [Zhongshania aliphaticivorans]CAA0120620.1 Uncharacterised protein [Zhongshania aliphaticivorans]
MTNPLMFFVELLRQSMWIVIWVAILMAANLTSLLFWDEWLAKTIFATFLISASAMLLMFSMVGYQRVLGLAHILWIPLLYFVLREIPLAEGNYKIYLLTLAVCNGLSLVLDVRDVWIHFYAKD